MGQLTITKISHAAIKVGQTHQYLICTVDGIDGDGKEYKHINTFGGSVSLDRTYSGKFGWDYDGDPNFKIESIHSKITGE